jgi:hypothetical protein
MNNIEYVTRILKERLSKEELPSIEFKCGKEAFIIQDDSTYLRYDTGSLIVHKSDLRYNEYDPTEARYKVSMVDDQLIDFVYEKFMGQKASFKSYVKGFGDFYTKYPNAL